MKSKLLDIIETSGDAEDDPDCKTYDTSDWNQAFDTACSAQVGLKTPSACRTAADDLSDCLLALPNDDGSNTQCDPGPLFSTVGHACSTEAKALKTCLPADAGKTDGYCHIILQYCD